MAAISEQTTTSAASILEQTVGVKIHIVKLGNRKKIPPGQIEIVRSVPDEDGGGVAIDREVDKRWTGANQQLMECEELDAIRDFIARLRRYVKTMCVKNPMGAGLYLVPKASLIEFDSETERMIEEEWPVLVRAFVDVYVQRALEAKRHRGSLWAADDYLSPDLVATKFYIEKHYVTFGTPRDIPPEMRERELARMRQTVAEAGDEIRNAMRAEAMKFVTWMVERMTGSGDGKKKVIHATKFEAMNEFLDGFGAKNITADTELAELVEQARSLMRGVDIKAAKSQVALRGQLGAGFAAIQEAMQPMIVEAPTRRLSLDDDEEDDED